jgi:hypothetical protein
MPTFYTASLNGAVDTAELAMCGLFMSAPVNYYGRDKQHSPCGWTGWFTLPPTGTPVCKKMKECTLEYKTTQTN